MRADYSQAAFVSILYDVVGHAVIHEWKDRRYQGELLKQTRLVKHLVGAHLLNYKSEDALPENEYARSGVASAQNLYASAR